MNKIICINEKINDFKKKIFIPEDKSLSIRCALLASQALGKSRLKLLDSEDIRSTLNCLKRLGIKIIKKNDYYHIEGRGINGFNFKKNLVLNCGNSGTLLRLLPSLLIRSPYKIKLIGDKSLSKRNFRVAEPLKHFGAQFSNNKTPPVYMKGTYFVRPITWREDKASAQIKTCCLIAGALHAPGITKVTAKPSRKTTENLFKHVLKIPTKIIKKKNFDQIEVRGISQFRSFNYNVPGDISSAAYPLVLTLLSKKSELIIKNVNVCPTRIGIITILRKMGATQKYIKFKNLRVVKGEKIADIFIKSMNNLKAIKLPKSFNNSSAIDEFVLIFICAAFSKGISTFRNLEELNKKESKRLDWSYKILKIIGIKTKKIGNHGIKIWGNPNLELKKNYIIKNYLKDHRIAMSTTVLGLARGGNWKIFDALDSIKTSFPTFIKMIKELGGKIN